MNDGENLKDERGKVRRAFINDALESQAAVSEDEPVYAAEEVFAYLRAKIAGGKPRKPQPIRRSR